MATKTVQIGSKIGLHARPAAIIAEAVKNSGYDVKISTKKKTSVNAKSPMMLISLGAKHNDDITVECADEETCEQIADMLTRDLLKDQK